MALADNETPSKWPVILNNGLVDSGIHRALIKQHKCRVSSSTTAKSVIYPLSGLAFLLIDVQEELSKMKEPEACLSTHLKERVIAFLQVHRHSYAILQSPFHGEKELKFLSQLQMEFLTGSMRILPSHSDEETVTSMNTIAKAHCKPASDVLKQRLRELSKRVNEGRHVMVLQMIGLDERDCQLLLDGIGSISRILTTCKEEILECGVSVDVYHKISHFMDPPTTEPASSM